MNDRFRCALDSLESFADDMLSRLSQYLDGYVIRDQVLFDQSTDKGVFCLRCCREANFDLFETDLYEQFEEFDLLLQAHRDDQGLVSITKVNAAPDWSFVYIFFLCPFHASHWRHKILSLIFCYVFHDLSSIL